ncbi:hypothetical protein AAC387_Pa02g4824 [Persea americana]
MISSEKESAFMPTLSLQYKVLIFTLSPKKPRAAVSWAGLARLSSNLEILSRKSRRSDSRFPIDWSHFVSKSQICCHSNRRKLQVGLQLENKEIFGTRTETEKINVLRRVEMCLE